MSNRHIRNLVFLFHRPILRELPPAKDSIVIPLQWELLSLDLTPYRIVNPSRWLSPQVAKNIQNQLDADWVNYLNAARDPMGRDFSYCFHIALSPLLYTKHIVASARREFSNSSIWVQKSSLSPEDINLSADFFRDLPTFLDVALPQAVNEVTFPEPTKTIGVAPESGLRRAMVKAYWHARHSLSGMALRAAKDLFRAAQARVPKVSEKEKLSGVMVVSQEAKTRLLRALLSHEQIPHNHLNYQEFEQQMIPGLHDKLFPLSSLLHLGSSTSEVLESWINFVRGVWRNPADKRLLFGAAASRILVHDAPHHPLIRRISRDLQKDNGFVGRAPEGVQHPVHSGWAFERNVYPEDYRETIFALGSSETIFWQHRNEAKEAPMVITGYLGNTRITRKTQLECWLFSMINRKKARKASIFVDLPLFANDYISMRPGVTGFEWLPEIQELIRALETAGFSVHANARGRGYLVPLAKAFRKTGLKIHTAWPWQCLALNAKLVISFDSSIILESVCVGRPVVVYAPKWRRGYNWYASTYQSADSNQSIFYATDANELVQIASRICSKESETSSNLEPFLSQNPDAAVDWIKGALERPGLG